MQTAIDPQSLSVFGVAAVINLLIIFFFCKSLIKTLSYIATENRALNPTIIWLLLIPGVNLVVNFFVVSRMSKSIEKELASRDFEEVKQPTYILGMVFAILSVVPVITFLPIPSSLTPIVGVAGFSQIFFFVQYWLKINWYKTVFEGDENPTKEV